MRDKDRRTFQGEIAIACFENKKAMARFVVLGLIYRDGCVLAIVALNISETYL